MQSARQSNLQTTARSSAGRSDVKPNFGMVSTNSGSKSIERTALLALSKASLTFDFLESNTASHSLFAAIAELVDNSKDASANTCHLELTEYKDEKGAKQPMFTILDNGSGMDTNEVHDVIMFGKSSKTGYGSHIGMYGLGMKAGAMRIAKDMLVLTKRHGHATCLLLSRTFLESYGLQDVHVAVPAFSLDLKKAYLNGKSELLHETEMNIVTRYSPFTSNSQLLEQFSRIKDTGTLIVLFNLRRSRSDTSRYEMQCKDNDIELADRDIGSDAFERHSLREYLSVLYSNPSMQLYINKVCVHTLRLELGLFETREYTIAMRGIDSAAKEEVEKLRAAVEKKSDLIGEIDTYVPKALEKIGTMMTDNPEDLKKKLALEDAIRETQKQKNGLRDEIKKETQKIQDLEKQMKAPAELRVVVGLSIKNRGLEGIYLYNNHRLVKHFRHQSRQRTAELYCRGVVLVCEVPRNLMRPTQDKQHFHDKTEFKKLKDKIMPCVDQFWDDSKLSVMRHIKLLEFWLKYGYSENADFADLPSNKKEACFERNKDAGNYLQCIACSKWRKIPKADFSADPFKCRSFAMSDFGGNCSAPEETFEFPKGNPPSKRSGAPPNSLAQSGWNAASSSGTRKQDKLSQLREQRELERALFKSPSRETHVEPTATEFIDPEEQQYCAAAPSESCVKKYKLRHRDPADTLAEDDNSDSDKEDESRHRADSIIRGRRASKSNKHDDRSYKPGMTLDESTSSKKRKVDKRNGDAEVTESDSEQDLTLPFKSLRRDTNDHGDAGTTSADSKQLQSKFNKITSQFRSLLTELTPKNFQLKRKDIEEMTSDELCDFPCGDFVKAVKSEAEALKLGASTVLDKQQDETENFRRELFNLRRSVAAYLKAAGVQQMRSFPTEDIETSELDKMLVSLCERTRSANASEFELSPKRRNRSIGTSSNMSINKASSK